MRRIVLELAEDTTDTKCGTCPNADSNGHWCLIFGPVHTRTRYAECKDAERAFSRLLDVSPEDARDRLDSPAARRRLMDAVDDHAKKAEVKP